MKLICEIGVVVALVLALIIWIRRDVRENPDDPEKLFYSTAGSIIGAILLSLLLYGAGAFSEIFK